MITGYDHFVQLAETLQWDETEIDFSADRAAWPTLGEDERTQVRGLLAGFVIAETAVAGNLGSYEAAAAERSEPGAGSMEAAFRSQARDEARHARFFDLVAADVAGVPGADKTQRLEHLRTYVEDELVDLFERRLPDTARQLAADHGVLTDAVGLYHMVIEGVVLLAGQHAMLDALELLSTPMPGLRKGMELVLRDERWHIGFGSRIIQNAAITEDDANALLERGESATKAWGDLITASAVDTAMRQHRRRLKATGVKFWSDA